MGTAQFGNERLNTMSDSRLIKVWWSEAPDMLGLFANESGASAIEYALIAGGISVVIAATVFVLGLDVNALFATFTGIF